MSHEHHGTASVILASRHLGVHAEERLNEAVEIRLTESGTPATARVSFDLPLDWPADPNYVTVTLPDGSSVEGVIADFDRSADGAGWITFTPDD